MTWGKEAHRIYARVHGRALREGFSHEIARNRAKCEVRCILGDPPPRAPRSPPKPTVRYHTEEERQAGRKRSRGAYARANAGPSPTRAAAGIPQLEKIIVPPDVLAEAERVKHLEHPDLTGRLMGDPLPCRSALCRGDGR